MPIMVETRICKPRQGVAICWPVALWLAIAGAFAGPVSAAEPVKYIGIYVNPFYRAGASPEEAPQVGTGNPHAPLLASTKKEDIIAARDMVIANPGAVTPMTMMVLAIRLYDFGERNDAVFWFYAAMDRYVTLLEVAEPAASMLAISTEAMHAFSALAGPFINGYAFCDIAKQREQRAKALAWVEANPYEAVFLEKLPARSPDRKAALAKAVAEARSNLEKEGAYLDNADNVAKLKAERQKNEMDAKFCWK